MWQRFTGRARRGILLGQEEAEKLGSAGVGPEHLLLGLARISEGGAAQVLMQCGVALDAVRQEVEAFAAFLPTASTGQEPKLTARSMSVLELAADEARRMRHDYIGTEHLLIALLRQKDGVAATVLRQLGLNLEKARHQVLDCLESAVPAKAAPGRGSQVTAHTYHDFAVTPETQILLRTALAHAYQRNQTALDVADLLMAMLQTDGWETALVKSGLDARAILQALTSRLEAYLPHNEAA